MVIEFDLDDVLFMSNTACQNFYNEKRERFQHFKSNIRMLPDRPAAKDKQGTMFFYDSQVSALIAYKVISERESAALLWDLVGEEWVVACSMDWKKYMKIRSAA
jgi:hypothetical protein